MSDTRADTCCWPSCDKATRFDPRDDLPPPPLCTGHIIHVTAFGTHVAQQLVAADLAAAAPRVDTRQPVVYYVRVGDHIKIGTTIDLTGRLRAMYLDHSVVLATEPGHYDLESQRHREFAAERVHVKPGTVQPLTPIAQPRRALGPATRATLVSVSNAPRSTTIRDTQGG